MGSEMCIRDRRFSSVKTVWAKGLREAAYMMDQRGLLENAMSYDSHVPLLSLIHI